MEPEYSATQLLVPLDTLPYFQALWPERAGLRIDAQHYIVPLAPQLLPPSERAWRWLKDVLAVLILMRRLTGLPPYEPGGEHMNIEAPLPSEVLQEMEPVEIATLLALTDFYDVIGVVEILLDELQRIQRRIKPAPREWVSVRTEDIVFGKEAAWRNGTRAWLIQHLHSLDMVARITKNWPRLGPLVACGTDHTLFLTEGQLWGCGWRMTGALGTLPDTMVEQRVSTPVKLQGPRDPVSVACGARHSVAVTQEGRLWVCGANNSGQLGLSRISQTENSWTESELRDVIRVACGEDFTVAHTSDGLWVTGDGRYGQLGLGPLEGDGFSRWTQVPLPEGSGDVIQVACCWYSLFVLTTSGLWACGDNDDGQLGQGDTAQRNVLTRVPLEQVDRIRCGGSFVYAATGNGLYVWGSNRAGQLGDDGVPKYLPRPALSKLPIAGNIDDIATGGGHVIISGVQVVRTGPEAYTISAGSSGLGQRAVSNGAIHSVRLYAGYASSFSLTRDGIWASGANTQCQLGLGGPPSPAVRTPGGEQVEIAIQVVQRIKKAASDELQDDRDRQRRRLQGLLCARCDRDAMAIETRHNRYQFCGDDCYSQFFTARH